MRVLFLAAALAAFAASATAAPAQKPHRKLLDLNDGAYVPAISDYDVPFNYLGTVEERAARGYTPPQNVMPDTPWTDSAGRDMSYFGWNGRPGADNDGNSNEPATQAAADTASLPNFSCLEQAKWGKCSEWWMAGKCNKSCGRCDAADGACTDVRPNGQQD